MVAKVLASRKTAERVVLLLSKRSRRAVYTASVTLNLKESVPMHCHHHRPWRELPLVGRPATVGVALVELPLKANADVLLIS